MKRRAKKPRAATRFEVIATTAAGKAHCCRRLSHQTGCRELGQIAPRLRATSRRRCRRRRGNGVSGLAHYERLFGRRRERDRFELDRESLPFPLTYLNRRNVLVGKPKGEWASIRCPSHKGGSEAHASMRVSLVDGRFRCMTCGAKGGDIVALHRLITGVSFVQAVSDIGGRFR